MPSALASHTILVVDDEANLRTTLALILQREGYFVTTASDMASARKLLQAGAFDLMFLDLKMPQVDGLALLPEIRRLFPDMPVLILTAHATLESAIEAVRQGARDYLLKPVDPPLIIARVSAVLADSKQPRRRREIMSEMRSLLTELGQMSDLDEPDRDPSGVQPRNGPARYLQRGPFNLDLHARHATLGDQPVNLSPTAFDYLVTLVRHSPDPVTYGVLVMESQGYKPSAVEARDLARWRIHELRKALESDPRRPEIIITVRNVGYRLIV